MNKLDFAAIVFIILYILLMHKVGEAFRNLERVEDDLIELQAAWCANLAEPGQEATFDGKVCMIKEDHNLVRAVVLHDQ